MNSLVSSFALYPGSLLRSGLKSTTKFVKKIGGHIKPNSKVDRDGGSSGTVVNTKILADGRPKPVAIQEC
jgi:hypothetical protein